MTRTVSVPALLLVLIWITNAPVRAQALPAQTPPELRKGVETITQYYAEVAKHLPAQETKKPTADGEGAADPAVPKDAMPDTPTPTPARASRPERDPFDVTPELRSRSPRHDVSIGANLFPSLPSELPDIQLRAVVAGAKPIAIIEYDPAGAPRGGGSSRNALRSVMLHEGDVLTLNDGATFRVKAIREGVVSILYGTDPNNEFLIR